MSDEKPGPEGALQALKGKRDSLSLSFTSYQTNRAAGFIVDIQLLEQYCCFSHQDTCYFGLAKSMTYQWSYKSKSNSYRKSVQSQAWSPAQTDAIFKKYSKDSRCKRKNVMVCKSCDPVWLADVSLQVDERPFQVWCFGAGLIVNYVRLASQYIPCHPQDSCKQGLLWLPRSAYTLPCSCIINL